MNKTGLLTIALLLEIVVNAVPLEKQAAEVLKQTPLRQNQMLRKQLVKTFPPDGMWFYENFALASYGLNEETDKADAGILTLQRDFYPAVLESFEAGGFHWHAYLLERICFLYSQDSKHFPGRMGVEAENAILEMLWAWAAPVCRKELADPSTVWWYWGSENHHIMAWVSFWGAAQIFKDHPDYKKRTYADGSSPAEMVAAFDTYFKVYAREHATKGLLVEVASPGYSKYTLNTWYNLADFAEDPVLKKRMDMLLNVYWADWAIEQIAGVRGGSRHRCYPGRSSTELSGGAGSAWYHFGRGEKKSRHPGNICAATTLWRPSPVVVELALDTAGRGEYAYFSRRPGLQEPGAVSNFVQSSTHPLHDARGINRVNSEGGALLRYSWCTPDFVLGMSQVAPMQRDDWTAISGQNHWNGVIFAGHPTARIFTQPVQPKRGSVYNAEWGVQSKGGMMVQRLRASNATGQMIWFDSALKRVETNEWVFVEAPEAYAAVRIARDGGIWKADTLAQRHDGKGRDGLGEWLVLKNEFSPVIIEVVRKKDFSDFNDFQSAILANPFNWVGKRVEYRSEFYGTTLSLLTDASEPPMIDGTPINFAPSLVYDSPYLRGNFGDGVVGIQKNGKKLLLDFTKKEPVLAE